MSPALGLDWLERGHLDTEAEVVAAFAEDSGETITVYPEDAAVYGVVIADAGDGAVKVEH